MKVMDVANTLGLTGAEVTGTIDEADVLSALAELGESDPQNKDLYDEAAERVRDARSAGVEELDAASAAIFPRSGRVTQLRYRSEMADIFTDLAIDVGLRDHRKLVDALL